MALLSKLQEAFWSRYKATTCRHQGGLPRTDDNGDVWQTCMKCASPYRLNVNMKVPGAVDPALRAEATAA